MHRNFLIDGYNLLHAMGLFPMQVGPHSLRKARGKMLAQLAVAHGDRAGNVTVVFDAPNAPKDTAATEYIRGIEVLYAVKHDEADDLIADLVAHDSVPRKLVVVSDDRRVLRSGSRRHCQTMNCETYLSWLEQQNQQRPESREAKPEKIENVNEQEKEHWMREFADLQDDPRMKEVFNPFDFEE